MKTNNAVLIKENRKIKKLLEIGKILRTFLLIGTVFVIIMPFVRILVDALKSSADLSNPLVYWIPEDLTLRRIRSIYYQLLRENAFYNSFLFSIVTALIQVIVCAIYGYTFSKLKFKGSNLLFWLIMFSLVVPRETLKVSSTLFFNFYPFLGIDLLHSLYGIYIKTLFGMGFYSPIFIYVFRQYFKGIPVELEEQAQLDGAGVIQTFWRVMLPNVKGAVMTVGIFTFVLTYNDSYYPMMFNFDMQNFELLSTKLVTGRYANVNAVALLIILPLLVLYIITQNIFIRGIENTVSNNQY